jgi:hypothetical protein
LFPKTRSVLRILYGLAVVLWPTEALAAGWPRENRLWLYVVISSALVVWISLLAVKNLSPRWCRGLVCLATLQVLALVYLGRSTGSALTMTVFLVPVSAFVALFLGGRAVLSHAVCGSLGLGLALTAEMRPGGAAVAGVVTGICMLSASATVRILIARTPGIGRSGHRAPERRGAASPPDVRRIGGLSRR